MSTPFLAEDSFLLVKLLKTSTFLLETRIFGVPFSKFYFVPQGEVVGLGRGVHGNYFLQISRVKIFFSGNWCFKCLIRGCACYHYKHNS